MRIRLLPLAIVLALMAARPAAAEGKKESKPSKPTIVVRFGSVDGVFDDVHYLASLVGQGDQVKMVRKLVEGQIGEKALKAFDLSKPLGLYGFAGPNGIDSKAVILLPVADETAIIDTLKGFGMNPEKQKNDIYKLDIPVAPIPAYFTFSDKYIYLTAQDDELLHKDKLLAPAKVLAGAGAVSFVINLDEIPKELKETALSSAGVIQAGVKDQAPPGETKEGKAAREAAVDELFTRLQQLLVDGKTISARVDLDRKTGNLAVEASLSGKAGSKLAKEIAEFGTGPSIAAGIIGAEAPIRLQLHALLPQHLREKMESAIEDGLKRSGAKDKGKGELEALVAKAVLPTLKKGDLDAGVSLRGPDASGLYTLIGAIKVQDGKSVGEALKQVLSNKEETDKLEAKITVDADQVGDVKIHKIVPAKVDEKAGKVIGDGTTFLAVRDDAVIVTTGPGALEAIKSAIKAGPAAGKILSLNVAMSRLGPIIATHNGTDATKVKKAFVEGDDSIRVVLEGGSTLKINIDVQTHIAKALVSIPSENATGRAPGRPIRPKKSE